MIEGIDQPWKRVPEGTVGGYWGLLDAERHAKFPLAGPVSEWPEWLSGALFTGIFAAIALVSGWIRRGRAGSSPWLVLGLAAPLAGAILWALVAQIVVTAIGWVGWIWGCFLVAIASAGALLTWQLIVDASSPWRVAPAPLPVLLSRQSREFPQAWVIGGFAWATRFTAAVLALLLAVDGRHRDYLTLAFILPACALAIHAWISHGNRPVEPQPEAGWVAIVLACAGLAGVDSVADSEAWAWAGCCLLLAGPWLPHSLAEGARIARLFRRGGQ